MHDFEEVLTDFEDIAPMRILKYCTTRWLSLDRAVKRLIMTWKWRRTKEMNVLKDVQFSLRPFTRFNAVFQTTASKISTMHIGSA